MREIFRTIFSANIFATGIALFLISVLVFYGTIYLLNYTNLGKKLGFLITGASVFAWGTIGSLLFVMYSPRGPQPAGGIEGLNNFEVRIIPLTFLGVSAILFAMFLVALHQYEMTQERADL